MATTNGFGSLKSSSKEQIVRTLVIIAISLSLILFLGYLLLQKVITGVQFGVGTIAIVLAEGIASGILNRRAKKKKTEIPPSSPSF
jgi:hypothetical protein